jgi:hypothetical protein
MHVYKNAIWVYYTRAVEHSTLSRRLAVNTRQHQPKTCGKAQGWAVMPSIQDEVCVHAEESSALTLRPQAGSRYQNSMVL